MTAIGNTVVTCSSTDRDCAAAQAGTGNNNKIDRFDFAMQNVGADAAAGFVNSSSADLAVTGTVAKALLIWSGEGSALDPTLVGKVKFITPAGATDVVASTVTGDYNTSLGGEYVASADVTSLVTAGGTYGVANVQATIDTSSYAGWTLMIVTHDAAQPERMLLLTAPVAMVAGQSPLSLSIPGTAGAASRDAHVIVGVFEGDRAQNLRGDTATLNGSELVAGGNAFAGRIGGGRSPQFDNNFGVDVLDVSRADIGDQDLTFEVKSSNDRVMVAGVAIALDLA